MWAGKRGSCPEKILLEPMRLDGHKELSFLFLFGHAILTLLNLGHRFFPKLFYNWHSPCPICIFCCQIPAFRNVLFWFNFSRILERRNCPVVKQWDWRPRDDRVWLQPPPQTSSVTSGNSLNPSVRVPSARQRGSNSFPSSESQPLFCLQSMKRGLDISWGFGALPLKS